MKKLSKETKIKLIYSGELLLFSILFLVFAILKFTNIMAYKETRRIIFNWITLFGGAWGITDFIWAINSKKRKQRISLIDKFLTLPLSLFIITFDLISLISKPSNDKFYITMIGIAFVYVSAIYLFQAVYHFYRPIPGLLDDEDDEKNNENSQEKPEILKENDQK